MQHQMNSPMFEQLLPLLGRTERDETLQAVLHDLTVKQPLKRPRRGDDTSYVHLNDQADCHLVFKLGQSPSPIPHGEKEPLLFKAMIIEFVPLHDDLVIALPLKLESNMRRASVLSTLGAPTHPLLRAHFDRWDFMDQRLQVFVTHRSDDSGMLRINYQHLI